MVRAIGEVEQLLWLLEREPRRVKAAGRRMPGIGRRRRIATPQLIGKLRVTTPAQPPLPTPENLPFQPSSGNHTSKRICESGVGAIVPATRQKGGRLPIAFVPPGGVNEPAVI